MEPITPPADALTLAIENNRLLTENNEMLKKMEKRYVRGFWFKTASFIVFFILPILLIPYFMNSYLSSLGVSTGMGGMFGGQEKPSNAQQILDLLQNKPSNPR
jgi:hypothetical protein